jgi:hypothetical protein
LAKLFIGLPYLLGFTVLTMSFELNASGIDKTATIELFDFTSITYYTDSRKDEIPCLSFDGLGCSGLGLRIEGRVFHWS